MGKVKLAVIAVLISTVFLSTVYFRIEELLFADRLDQMELQIKNQVSTMVSAYQTDSKYLTKWVQFIAEEGTKKINWQSLQPYFAVAQLNANLQIVEWAFREKSPISSMSKETLTQLIASFEVSAEDKEITYKSFIDQDKKRVVLTLVPYKEKLWVFASLGENLQVIMDSQKTSPYTLALINSDLVSISHVKTEYVGQKISKNKIINEIIDSSKNSYSGVFNLPNGEEFFALIEKVPNMDLFVYSQISLTEISANKNSIKSQYLFFSLGYIFILVSSLIIFMGSSLKLPDLAEASGIKLKSNKKNADEITQTQFSVNSKNEVKTNKEAPDGQKEKTESYMKIASALGHEIKGPLIKILGLAQGMLIDTNQNKDKEGLFKIQKETRQAKEIIEKLLTFAGEKSEDKIETKIDTPLLRALKNFEVIFYQKAIKIHKDFGDVDTNSMDVKQMTTVIENILKNSITSLERKLQKEIKIKSFKKGTKTFIEISDNGEGIEKSILDKIFDPFFTTHNLSKNLGLGLTVAMGIVREHGGDIRVESERGKGTKVIIELDKAASVKVSSSVVNLPIQNDSKIIEPEEDKKSQVPEHHISMPKNTLNTHSDDEFEIKKLTSVNINLEKSELDSSISSESENKIVHEQQQEDSLFASEENENIGFFEPINNSSDQSESQISEKATEIPSAENLPPIPIDLSVNVDHLFDSDEFEIPPVPVMVVNKGQIENSVNEKNETKEDVKNTKMVLITTPKSAPVQAAKKPIDDFKIKIRKPRGHS